MQDSGTGRVGPGARGGLGARAAPQAANRGTQHLWFRNPVMAGSDRRSGLLATHPSLGARIDRLRVLQGLDPLDPSATVKTNEET